VPVRFVKWYTEDFIRANPDWLFVYGDNLDRHGKGGQAAVCRGKLNTIGIPVKRSPCQHDAAYFSNDDIDEWRKAAGKDMIRIEKALFDGKMVVFPERGIGTGLAQLEKRAPLIWHELQAWLDNIFEHN